MLFYWPCVRELGTAATLWEEYFNTDFNTFVSKIFEVFNYTTAVYRNRPFCTVSIFNCFFEEWKKFRPVVGVFGIEAEFTESIYMAIFGTTHDVVLIARTPVDLRCIIFVGATNQPLNIPKGIINNGAKRIYKNVNNIGPDIFNLAPMCNNNDTFFL